jgi:hypothetical protein
MEPAVATDGNQRQATSPRRTCSASSQRHGTRPYLRPDATLVVWSPDYDGKGKAWVRFDDGTDAIVGGSRVER